jgi:uncharacterized protein (TIGR02996 family)
VSERNAFLEALDANEDDTTTRLVYADWLDERGEHEEADRQRKWPAAREWLVRFCRAHNPPSDDDPFERTISYKELLELGREAVEEADESGLGFYCGNNQTMCNALRAHSREFWKNWSVVTGIPLPPGAEDMSYTRFNCAC